MVGGCGVSWGHSTVPSWTWWEGCFSRNFPASSKLYLTAPVISTSDTSAGPGLGGSVPAARVPLGKAQDGGSSASELGCVPDWLHVSMTVVSRFFLSNFTQAADHPWGERSLSNFSPLRGYFSCEGTGSR